MAWALLSTELVGHPTIAVNRGRRPFVLNLFQVLHLHCLSSFTSLNEAKSTLSFPKFFFAYYRFTVVVVICSYSLRLFGRIGELFDNWN